MTRFCCAELTWARREMADLGAASRPVNDKELAEAQRLGIKLAERVIGFDGVSVIVLPGNPMDHLTVEEIGRIFTGQVTSWKEISEPPGRRLRAVTMSHDAVYPEYTLVPASVV